MLTHSRQEKTTFPKLFGGEDCPPKNLTKSRLKNDGRSRAVSFKMVSGTDV